MQQQGTVTAVVDGGYVLVQVLRKSACAGDCGSCSGCHKQTLTVRAANPLDAKPGDTVLIASETKTLLFTVLLVYMMPLLNFFLGYWFGSLLKVSEEGFGILLFLLSLLPAMLYNRFVQKHDKLHYRICRIMRE